jgi:hypothetical protein
MRKSRLTGKGRRKRSHPPVASSTDASEYQVGPGRPPKQFQFKPGQSGNPKGARRKTSSIEPDIKALLKRALNRTVTLSQGEKEQIITKKQAGIEQLVNQYAKGDRYARRDVMDLADKYDVDLVAGQRQAIEKALEADLAAHDQALLDDYVRRHRNDPDLAESKDAETPSSTNPSEKET